MKTILMFLLVTISELIVPSDVKLLDDFTETDYDTFYEQVPHQFFGWSTYTIYDELNLRYISDALFSYANASKEVIHYDYSYNSDTKMNNVYTFSGEVDINAAASILKTVKVKLAAKISAQTKQTETKSAQEKWRLDIDVMPYSQISLFKRGEVKLTLGVSKYYFFGFEMHKGGWEVIDVTNEDFWLLEEWI